MSEDEDWVVRSVTGESATRAYRCPGCDQEIRAGLPHLVVWPAWPPGDAAVEERRHWHRVCWERRGRRSPRVQRSRDAPRY